MTIALTLALAAVSTPVAIANATDDPVVRPNPDEQTLAVAPHLTEASCGDVCSGDGYGSVSTPIARATPGAVVRVAAPAGGL